MNPEPYHSQSAPPPPASAPSNGPAPAPQAPAQLVGGEPVSSITMPPRRHYVRRVSLVAVVLVALVGASYIGYSYWHARQLAAHRPAPTPAPITTQDVESVLNDVNNSLQEVDANFTGLDASLNDQQGDLSE